MQAHTRAPPDEGPLDWLGYQQYANSLWARIVHGFAQESARSAPSKDSRNAPAGDPMVIGVYGEWGVGKSRLLELTYALAAAQSAQDCSQRALDPHAYRTTDALRLTVPVWFHPWKYEHEEHLAVPLLMHIADAVCTTLKDAHSLTERTKELIQAKGKSLNKTAAEISDAVEKGSALVQRVAKAAYLVASNDLVKTTTSVAAGFFGLAPAADKILASVADTSKKLAGEDSETDAKASKKTKAEGEKDKVALDKRPIHSVDGRYYYNVQKYLRELAHITPEKALEHGVTLDHEVHLNFVVFVDDLDRCLPEKAVEVLEVIKTVLNIECFAFLVALDDEVIERGISHRYRDYRFVGAKPEMPITGFEYLEKIVHLPFRLPQLTRSQAASFILHQESRLHASTTQGSAALPRLWYRKPGKIDLRPGASPLQMQLAGFDPSPLVNLLLDSFEAYVPRKLARTIELLRQFQQVLAARSIAMEVGVPGKPPLVDSRMVLFTITMQLFAPELFRLLRRRPGMFGQWMRANLSESTSTSAVFEWRKVDDDDPLVLEVSDADLYRWAAMGSQAAPSPQPGASAAPGPGAPSDGTRGEWAVYLGKSAHSQSDRHSVEQLRLPFAIAISEFRNTQRHAFSPLRLGAAMAYTMDWAYTTVPSLESYMQLFADIVVTPSLVEAPKPPDAIAPVISAPTPAPAARTARSVNAREMIELVTSSDAATRASLVERLGLRTEDVLDSAAVEALSNGLSTMNPLFQPLFLIALAALGPHLEPATVSKFSWQGLPAWTLGSEPSNRLAPPTPQVILETATPYARLNAVGLTQALGLQASVGAARDWVGKLVSSGQTDPALQPLAIDMLRQLGEPQVSLAA